MKRFVLLVLTVALLAGFAFGFAGSDEKGRLVVIVEQFFAGMKEHDAAKIGQNWLPDGKIFIGKTLRELAFLKGIPPFIKIELDGCELLAADGEIALVKAKWRMLMPETTGFHVSYLNLVGEGGQWKIASMTDYGIEQPNK